MQGLPALQESVPVAGTSAFGVAAFLFANYAEGSQRLAILSGQPSGQWVLDSPDVMAEAGMTGVGIVPSQGKLFVVGAIATNGLTDVKVFVSSGASSWEEMSAPELTQSGTYPIGVAAAGGHVAVLMAATDATLGGSPRMLVLDPDGRTWTEVDLNGDSNAVVTSIAGLGTSFVVSGCGGPGRSVGVLWTAPSWRGPYRPDQLGANTCLTSAGSSADRVAVAGPDRVWFTDGIQKTEVPMPMLAGTSHITIRAIQWHDGVWQLAGEEWHGEDPIAHNEAIWTIPDAATAGSADK
jgi:hypothetical protein